MNDLKKQYEQETERNPVYQIQPHDAGFKMPSLGYIKWLEEKLQTPQPEGVKPEESFHQQLRELLNKRGTEIDELLKGDLHESSKYGYGAELDAISTIKRQLTK